MLEIENLSGGYGNIDIIQDISLQIDTAETATIIGPNGSGKTTFLRAICNHKGLQKSSGTVTWQGENITDMKPQEIVRMGMVYVPQDKSVFPKLTVKENLKMGGWTLSGEEREEKVEEMLRKPFPVLGERKNETAENLSGGQQQMLELARGLMTEPSFLMIDESSQGLSPQNVNKIFNAIEEIGKEKTVILVAQNVKKGMEVCDTLYALREGRITYQESKDKITENPPDIASRWLRSVDSLS